MITEKKNSVFRRVFSGLLTVLLMLHFVCVPSMTAFAEGDVQVIGIGGDSYYRASHYDGKTVEVIFRHDYETDENYALVTTSAGESERVVLSRGGKDVTSCFNNVYTIEKFGARFKIQVTSTRAEMVSTVYDGFIRFMPIRDIKKSRER